MSVRQTITDLHADIIDWRRTLHQNPQTCYEEEFASALIAGKLREWDIPFDAGWAKTGIVARIDGNSTASGRSIGLRADIDALDIIEQSGQPWASKIPGKMHGCGHDGHTAMLLGAAKILKDNPDFDGTVYLIFQPAEEGGGGAIQMIEQGLFDRYPMDAVYGMHNWPFLKRGTFGICPGPAMAGSDTFTIHVTGKGGHAALPQNTVDPVPVACQIVTNLQSIVARTVDPIANAVLSVTNINAGTGASNVIPGEAHLIGTVRTFDPALRDSIIERMRQMIEHIATAHGAEATLDYQIGYEPTVNDPEHAEICRSVAQEIVGESNVQNEPPCMGAEDFGAMLQKKPGFYIFLGQGEESDPDSPHNKACHHPGYDFNDQAAPIGVEYWVGLVEKILEQ